MENASVLNIRISQELKQTLDKQAQQKSQTVSDLVREMLEKAVTQDGGGIAGISPALMEMIRSEAQKRNMPTPQLVKILLQHGYDRLRKNTRMIIFD